MFPLFRIHRGSMSITTPVYKLPKDLRKQALSDCYNALRRRGISHERARYEISHCIICSRLCDLEYLVDVFEYRL